MSTWTLRANRTNNHNDDNNIITIIITRVANAWASKNSAVRRPSWVP